jgi:hypothetical protein
MLCTRMQQFGTRAWSANATLYTHVTVFGLRQAQWMDPNFEGQMTNRIGHCSHNTSNGGRAPHVVACKNIVCSQDFTGMALMLWRNG